MFPLVALAVGAPHQKQPFTLTLAAPKQPLKAGARGRSTAPSPLSLHLRPTALRLDNVPLSKALEKLGNQVQGGYVLFGLELKLKNGREPLVKVDIPPGETVKGALGMIFYDLPDYKYESVSEHLINIYPVRAKEDPKDVLNILVPRLDIVDKQAGDILSRPKDFIPQLAERLAPPTRPGHTGGTPMSILSDVGPPTTTLHLRNVTVCQILNAASEATEEFPAKYMAYGWVYSFDPDPTLPAGGKHSWAVLWSVPYDWKHEADKTGGGPTK